MPRRGDRTRERILDAAEALYGTLGVANVSLRQIRIASEQRNDAAVQYHFGDRDGILRALNARHMPRIGEIAATVLARDDTDRSKPLLVEAMVRPWAEYVTRGPSERAFVRIAAELGSDPTLSFDSVREHGIPEIDVAAVTLLDLLTPDMTVEVAVERLWTIARFAVQTAAERARLADAANPARPLLPDELFIANLVAMAVSAVAAPSPTGRTPQDG